MTDRHIVQIRRARSSDEWLDFTRAPIAHVDADNLRSMIGEHWESRMVLVDFRPTDMFAELEDKLTITGVARWEKARLNHHPDCATPDRASASRQHEAWSTYPLGSEETDAGDSAILTGSEWLANQALERAANELRQAALVKGVELSVLVRYPKVHFGKCTKCGATKRALSVVVAISWEDTTITREYAL